jgi:hypothetical protein
LKEPQTEPEWIAELLDGRLQEPERSRLLAHLATSDEFRELVETAAVLREAEEEGAIETRPSLSPRAETPVRPVTGSAIAEPPPSVSRPRGWRPRRAHWLTLAALLIVAVLGPVLWRRGDAGRDHPGVPASLLATADAGLPAGWTESPPWESTLGADDPLTETARAIRAGALHTDLGIALAAGDAGEVRRLRAQLDRLLTDVQGSAPVTDAYGRVESAAAGESAAVFEEAGAALAERLGADEVRWGAWVEGVRVAAARGDSAFFRADETRAWAQRAHRLPGLSQPAQEATSRLARMVQDDERLSSPDLKHAADELMRLAAS